MDKQHILREIKRTAAVNGGVPPGRRRFFLETGIREFDWRGKFWARWGDALHEAGFEPNEKRQAYDEGVLIEKYIGVLRDLQHFPTRSELRLRGRQVSGFPNDATFVRLGSTKRQIATTILEYCSGRDGYDDILALCAPHLEAALVHSRDQVESQQEAAGSVYLIKSGRHYKIGSTNAVGRREYELSIQLPEKVRLVHEIRTDDPSGIEAYWHRRFAAKRKGGEWFALDSHDVSAFRRRKFM